MQFMAINVNNFIMKTKTLKLITEAASEVQVMK